MSAKRPSKLQRARSRTAKGRSLKRVVIPPLSEHDFQLAIAMARIRKQYGSLAAFFEAQEKEQERKDRELREWQDLQLAAV